jgi:hypothetical protein
MPVSPKSRRCRCWEGKTGMAALTKWAQTLGVSGAAYPAVALPVAIPKGRATILGITGQSFGEGGYGTSFYLMCSSPHPASVRRYAIPKGRATILGIPSLRVSAVWPCRLWDKRDQSIVVWTSRTCRTF